MARLMTTTSCAVAIAGATTTSPAVASIIFLNPRMFIVDLFSGDRLPIFRMD